MAETHDLSRITDANGDNWDIAAKKLETQKTFAITGDVSGSQNSDLASGVSIPVSIGNGKVTTAKIADGNVTTAKIADGNVTLDKIADAAKSGAVSDNDGKLATHAQVKSAIDAAIAGQGSYLGKQTVAIINTWTAANLVNGDRVIASDSGTVTLGNIAVRAGEDLIFWKSGTGSSQVAIWQSMDGEFKLKQTAKSDPTASGTTLTAIASISQDANGEITATKKTIQDGTTSKKGVVQLQNSLDTTTTKAVTPNAVKTATDALDSRIAAIEGSYVTGVKGSSESTYRTGDVNITKANIGLGNVDNKSEATIKSDFTGSIASGNTNFVKGGDVFNALAGKESSFAINYKSSENALVFHKVFGTES